MSLNYHLYFIVDCVKFASSAVACNVCILCEKKKPSAKHKRPPDLQFKHYGLGSPWGSATLAARLWKVAGKTKGRANSCGLSPVSQSHLAARTHFVQRLFSTHWFFFFFLFLLTSSRWFRATRLGPLTLGIAVSLLRGVSRCQVSCYYSSLLFCFAESFQLNCLATFWNAWQGFSAVYFLNPPLCR